MSLLLETIKVLKNRLWNVRYHNARMNRSVSELFKAGKKFDLAEIIIPPDLPESLHKCRIIYSDTIQSIEFLPYFLSPVTSLKIVRDNLILYDHKFLERGEFQRHLNNAGGREVLIVKNGFITDTSYSNVVLSDEMNFYTPASPLLRGTKREKLLSEGKIQEAEIRIEDLSKYKYLYLINAMIDLEDGVRIPVGNIEY